MKRCLGIVVACSVLPAVIVVGAAASAQHARALEFAVSLDAVQTTSWAVKGSYAWCSLSSQRLPFAGSGRAMLHLSLPADAHGAATPGAPFYLGGMLSGTVVRAGSYVEHDAAVTDRPPGCPAIDTADSAVGTSGCGRKAATLAVTVESGALR